MSTKQRSDPWKMEFTAQEVETEKFSDLYKVTQPVGGSGRM